MNWKDNKGQGETTSERLLELCDKAIELLRDANRMFYLWELFCMREQLAVYLPDAIRTEENFLQRAEQCTKWKETLEEIYRDYNVSIAMYEFCYLYVESENYCIGDVIRIRRKMLGLSQEKLSEGICDSRTVSRLERHISKPQKEIVQLLFDRLNLSTELCRTELVTDSQEAIEKYVELKIKANNHEYEKSRELLDELKKMISMDNSNNMQVLDRNDLVISLIEGKLKGRECVDNMKRVLEYTVPYESAVAKGEKYLTMEEISCIENMTVGIDWTFDEMRECVNTLEEICSVSEKKKYVRLQEYTILSIASHLGNNGKYLKSNGILTKLMISSLNNRRMSVLNYGLYSMLWNAEQSAVEKNIEYYKIKELKKCIYLSDLSKDTYRKKAYENKIMLMRDSSINKSC